MRRLILNADDFGLTAGVNRAVAELHQAGAITSCSLMARAQATEEAIEIARSTPSLGVGCHVVLADGAPVLPASEIPHLSDPVSGELRASAVGFLARLFGMWPMNRAMLSEIEAEAAAQIASLQSRGVSLTHVDTHKHFHIFPAVLRPVLRAAKAAGISKVRNPFEPAWSVRATASSPWVRRAAMTQMRRLESAFQRIVSEEGFTTTDGIIGGVASGLHNAGTLTTLLDALPEGTFELVTHPGYNDRDLARVHTRLRASRANEREALLALPHSPDVAFISFAGLVPHDPESSQKRQEV